VYNSDYFIIKRVVKQMSVFETIKKRHSTRRYHKEPLDKETREQILAICSNVDPFEGLKLDWQVEDDDKATGMIYAVKGSDDKKELVRYGFEGEQIILKLTDKGYQTLWKALNTGEHTPAIIRFGKGKKKSFVDGFTKMAVGSGRRKPLETFTDKAPENLSKTAKRCFEAARLAPSGINRQPWFFKEEDNALVVGVTKKAEINAIDLGIVLSHVYLMLKEMGVAFEFEMADDFSGRFKLKLTE